VGGKIQPALAIVLCVSKSERKSDQMQLIGYYKFSLCIVLTAATAMLILSCAGEQNIPGNHHPLETS